MVQSVKLHSLIKSAILFAVFVLILNNSTLSWGEIPNNPRELRHGNSCYAMFPHELEHSNSCYAQVHELQNTLKWSFVVHSSRIVHHNRACVAAMLTGAIFPSGNMWTWSSLDQFTWRLLFCQHQSVCCQYTQLKKKKKATKIVLPVKCYSQFTKRGHPWSFGFLILRIHGSRFEPPSLASA